MWLQENCYCLLAMTESQTNQVAPNLSVALNGKTHLALEPNLHLNPSVLMSYIWIKLCIKIAVRNLCHYFKF